MALPLYMIGPHRFITLNSAPLPPTQDVIVDARPGVDGLQFTLTGLRGRPFSLFSRVDGYSYDAGIETYVHQYRHMPEFGLVDLVINDFFYNTVNLRAQVLRVSPFGRFCYRAFPIVGGLGSGTTHLLECEWEMVLVQPPAS